MKKCRVVIPVFFGTNSEDEMGRAFRESGAVVTEVIIRSLTAEHAISDAELLASVIEESDIIAIPGGFSGGDEPYGSAKFITAVFKHPKVTASTNDLLQKRNGLMIGICNGFQALVKLGVLKYGFIPPATDSSMPTLSTNTIARHDASYTCTVITSTKSPWLSLVKLGEVYVTPFSHGEGRFTINGEFNEAQIWSKYCNSDGIIAMNRPNNPNGSDLAVEGIVSPCGRVLGKMCHIERVSKIGQNVIGKNIYGRKYMPIIEAGVKHIIMQES